MKLLVINGPNLNVLGLREKEIYGSGSYAELLKSIADCAKKRGISVDVVQHNCEGKIIDAIQSARGAYDAVIINPGAYTHYSYAIHDALQDADVDVIEVHISNIAAREQFRRTSVTAPACLGQISGLGFYGYIAAMNYFADKNGE